MIMKTCGKAKGCGKKLPLTAFYRHSGVKGGYQRECKECQNKYRNDNAEKFKIYDRRKGLKKKFKISIEFFDELLKKQNGLCAICGKPPKLNKNLHVDHCHFTNHIRGLLCGNCNTALGLMYDNFYHLIKAAEYIKIHSEFAKLNIIENDVLTNTTECLIVKG